jgi:hypothetical protein
MMHCGELQVQSCHSYCSRGSEQVAKLNAKFFYMLLEKHVCNALFHCLLLALAVVIFDH